MNDLKMFDTHAHYTDDRFKAECSTTVDDLISSVFADNVGYIVNVGTNYDNSAAAIQQAKKFKNMYAAVGIHPSDSANCGEFDFEISRIDSLLTDKAKNKIVALGEIGFDYHYDDTDKQTQTKYFDAQMRLAEKHSVPVIIHDRDAHGDCFDMIRRFPKVNGVFHSYSGSCELARQLVERGYYISISGVVTFKNANRVREVVKSIPLDRLMIETDCPYLAPHPHRGELNYSGFMIYTLEQLAGIFEISPEKINDITKQNACRFFGIAP